MADNLAKIINHYGQLTLLIVATILGLTLVFSYLLMLILPLLGMWQLIDFIVLWSENGYKKWYAFACVILISYVLLGLALYNFSSDNEIVILYILLSISFYSIVVAWVYLLYWRKQ